MRRTKVRTAALAGAALMMAASLAAPVSAGGPGRWTSLGLNTANYSVPGLERSADGSLIVLWARPNLADAGDSDVVSTQISPAGDVGSPVPLVSGWSFVDPIMDVVTDTTAMRGFWGGTTPQLSSGLWTSSGSGSPPAWGPSSMADEYGGGVAATKSLDGTLYQTFVHGSVGLVVHKGLDPSTPLSDDYQAQLAGSPVGYNPNIVTDQVTGEIWLVWYSAEPTDPADASKCLCGVYAQKVDPATGDPVGQPVRMPRSYVTYDGKEISTNVGNRVAVAARPTSAGGGIYVVYTSGYPTPDKVLLWEIGASGPASSSRVIANIAASGGNYPKNVAVTSDPQGRLWVLWTQEDKIKATVSEESGAAFAPVISVSKPSDPSVNFSYNLVADAQDDRVDVLVNWGMGGAGTAFWHTQIKEVPEWTAGADTITGTGGKDVLYGGGGADTLKAAGGNDALYGGDGNDKLDGGRGKDFINGGKGKDTCFKTKGDRFKSCEVIKTKRSR